MKYLFLTLPVLAILASVAPAMENNSVVTIESVQSTATISGMLIDTQTPTSIVVSTAPLYRQVCVQNFDTSAFLSCSEHVSVSTITSSNRIGTIIPKVTTDTSTPAPICFSVVAGNHFYCKSSGSAPTRCSVTRKR